MTIKHLYDGPRMSQVVVYNGIVYLSGQTAGDAGDDVQSQTRAILKKIDDYLESAGTKRSQLLSATIWLSDINHDFQLMNEVWQEWIADDPKPVRATVEANLARPELKVEIQVIAAL